MPTSRRKSVLSIAGQAGRLSGRIEALRRRRLDSARGVYGDARDRQLRERENRVLRAANRYARNIRARQGIEEDYNNPITDSRLNNARYSRNTYMGMGLANG